MKKIIYALIMLGTSTVYAQSVVYRCVDSIGNVSYLNSNPLSKNSGCHKTDLADPDKSQGMVIRVEGENKNISNVSISSSNRSSSSGNIPAIKSYEQKKKDEGRVAILSKELEDEQEQLMSVQKMLKNIEGSKDTEQISKLKEMENRHFKNIASLKKELGVKIDATVAKTEDVKVNNIKNISTEDSAFNAMMIKKEIKMNPTITQVNDTNSNVSTSPKAMHIPNLNKNIEVKSVKPETVSASVNKVDEKTTFQKIESFLKLR